MHWRVLCMDGQARKAYCIYPYGDKASISFYSRSARSVLQTLQVVLAEQGSSEWTLQVTTHPWQNSCDGHSCGIWVAWLCERFMQFVTDRPEESDFERWASAQYPNQSALRARYHDMYHQQHPEENPLQASTSLADKCPSQTAQATAAHTSTKLTSHQDHGQLRSDNGLSDTRVASRGKAKKSFAGRRPAPVFKLRIRPVSTKRKLRKSARGHAR